MCYLKLVGVIIYLIYLSAINALTIDNQLKIIKNDCYDRLAIGHRLSSKDIYKTYKLNTVSACQQACTKEKSSCKALSFGIGVKGNATCQLGKNVIKESADLKPKGTIVDQDFDLYIKKMGCTLVIDKKQHIKPPGLFQDPVTSNHHYEVQETHHEKPSEHAFEYGNFETNKPQNIPEKPVSTGSNSNRPQIITHRPSSGYDSASEHPHRPEEVPIRPLGPYDRPNKRPEETPNRPYFGYAGAEIYYNRPNNLPERPQNNYDGFDQSHRPDWLENSYDLPNNHYFRPQGIPTKPQSYEPGDIVYTRPVYVPERPEGNYRPPSNYFSPEIPPSRPHYSYNRPESSHRPDEIPQKPQVDYESTGSLYPRPEYKPERPSEGYDQPYNNFRPDGIPNRPSSYERPENNYRPQNIPAKPDSFYNKPHNEYSPGSSDQKPSQIPSKPNSYENHENNYERPQKIPAKPESSYDIPQNDYPSGYNNQKPSQVPSKPTGSGYESQDNNNANNRPQHVPSKPESSYDRPETDYPSGSNYHKPPQIPFRPTSSGGYENQGNNVQPDRPTSSYDKPINRPKPTNGYNERPQHKPQSGYNYDKPPDSQNNNSNKPTDGYYNNHNNYNSKTDVQQVQTLVSISSGPNKLTYHPVHDIFISSNPYEYGYPKPYNPTGNNYLQPSTPDRYGSNESDLPPFRPSHLNNPYDNDRPRPFYENPWSYLDRNDYDDYGRPLEYRPRPWERPQGFYPDRHNSYNDRDALAERPYYGPYPDKYAHYIPHPNDYYPNSRPDDYNNKHRPQFSKRPYDRDHSGVGDKRPESKPVYSYDSDRRSDRKPVSNSQYGSSKNESNTQKTNKSDDRLPDNTSNKETKKTDNDKGYADRNKTTEGFSRPVKNENEKQNRSESRYPVDRRRVQKPIISQSYGPNGQSVTSIITEISQTSCFRRALAGKRVSRHLVQRSLFCETAEDCQKECADEKYFLCEGFNYRLDPSGRGRGDCELLDLPLSRLDLRRDIYPDRDYDYYERDRNAPTDCRPGRGGYRRPPGGYYSEEDYRDEGDYDYPAPPPPPYGGNRRGDFSYHESHHSQSDNSYYHNHDRNDHHYLPNDRYRPENHYLPDRRPDLPKPDYPRDRFHFDREKDRNYWGFHDNWGSYGGSYGNFGYGGGYQNNNRHDYDRNTGVNKHYLPPKYGSDNNYWGQYGGTYGNGYYGNGHGNGYAPNSDYWNNSNKLPNSDILPPYNKPNGGSYLPTPYKPGGYYNSDRRVDHVGGQSPSFNHYLDSILPAEPRLPTYDFLRDECSLRSASGFKLHKTIVKKYYAVPSIYECELLCFKEAEFICQSYAYRYTISPSAPTENCYLSNRNHKELNYYTDLEPDRDFDIYTMNNQNKCLQPVVNHREMGDCFYRVRSGQRLDYKIVRDTLSVRSIIECQIACLEAKRFTCRVYSFRYGSPTIGGSVDNCQLTDWPFHELDPRIHFLPETGFEVYERGSYGHGCEPHHPLISGNKPNPGLQIDQICYIGFGTPARLLPQATRKALRTETELECKAACSKAREGTLFQCMSFSYRHGGADVKPNCELSDIMQRDLLINVDFAPDTESRLYAWDNYNPECTELANKPIHDHGSHNTIDNDNHRIDHGPSTGLDTWRVYSVSGWPCRKGTRCKQNRAAGFWYCELEFGDQYAWDYCCRPDHQCGYSKGYRYQWCYVGPIRSQWRKCNDRYYPYIHTHVDKLEHNRRKPYLPAPSFDNIGGRPYLPRPSFDNHSGKPYLPRPSFDNHGGKPYLPRPSFDNHGGRPYLPGPPYYENNSGNRPYLPAPPQYLPTASSVVNDIRPNGYYPPFRPDRPQTSYGNGVPDKPQLSLDEYEAQFDNQFLDPPKPGGFGQPRHWPVMYLHKDKPPIGNDSARSSKMVDKNSELKYQAIQNLINAIRADELSNVEYQIGNNSKKENDVLLVKIHLPANFTKEDAQKKTLESKNKLSLDPIDLYGSSKNSNKRSSGSAEVVERSEVVKNTDNKDLVHQPLRQSYRRGFVTRTNVTSHVRRTNRS